MKKKKRKEDRHQVISDLNVTKKKKKDQNLLKTKPRINDSFVKPWICHYRLLNRYNDEPNKKK
ncbi:hypothetical protein DERF_011882 [Dermatophagoides farinae]|uniref:Uncharacterized protein n=1 Tax=Dermatophagoides farinae TaxID=6954 RepID=A0A922HNW6_DERFA|nr:hypothetical protein DERF_011882 [Dermatophagoides farinae]